jgi:hypothetical protein
MGAVPGYARTSTAIGALPLMVIRHVEHAAFTGDPAVPFVVLEDMATVLQADSEPAAGPVWPTSGLPTRH